MEINNIDISYHDYHYFDNKAKKDIKRISFKSYPKDIWLRSFVSNKIQISTVMISKAVKDSGIRLPEDFRNGQDIEYFKELSMHYDFFYCNTVCSRFRVKEENIGFNPTNQLKYKSAVYKKIKIQNLDLPIFIILAYQLANICFILNTAINLKKFRIVSLFFYLPHYIFLRIYRFFL